MAARDWDEQDDETTPCACERRCSEADHLGNPARGPRPFCRTDELRIRDSIRALPADYTGLSQLLAKSAQQQGERVTGGGSTGAPVPMALHTDALMREIVMIATSWEGHVIQAASLSRPEGHDDGTRRWRPGPALQHACETLAGKAGKNGHLATLLSLDQRWIRRFVPGDLMLRDIAPGTSLWIDESGDAWGEHEVGGTYAGLELLRLHARARAALGLNPRRRKVTEVTCDECDQKTLVQREAVAGGWEPVVRCANCRNAYIGKPFDLLMDRVQAAMAKALGHAG
jgi:hypothetical protein